MPARKAPAFTPYFSEDEAGQVLSASQNAGAAEGDASVFDFIVRATMREVKRLRRKKPEYEMGPRSAGVVAEHPLSDTRTGRPVRLNVSHNLSASKP